MSSTGRGAVRNADDFYSTPEWCTRLFFHALKIPKGTTILDPCCGDGAILEVASDLGYATEGIELDAERAAEAAAKGFNVVVRDALSADPWAGPAVILTNPPYTYALEFVERAIAESGGRDVAMLLRLAFVASKKRAAFHKKHPSDIYPLSRRPSYTGKGTDSADYALFVWGEGRGNRWFPLVEDEAA